jgi:hypothetical protein
VSGLRPADFGRAFVRFRRPNPFVLAWRWRYELSLALAALVLARGFGTQWTVLFGAVLAAVLATPYGRRRFWVIAVQHGIRTGCKHAWVHSRTARIPALLWTTPVPEGEQVLLLLPPGVSAADLAEASHLLAGACWAGEVRVVPDPTRAHLVRLTVVRYEVVA